MLRRRTLLAATLVLVCAASASGAQAGRWELLGSRTVTDRADRDTLKVGAEKGNFTAVKFGVQRRAVRFKRVVIHFRNGDDQKVDLPDTIGANGESRVIDIDGRDRVIRSIDFWYDAQSLGRGGQATVRILGRN